MPSPLLVTFQAGLIGSWRIDRITAVVGAAMLEAPRLAIIEGAATDPSGVWSLRGVTSNQRYAERQETTRMASVQEGLGRPQATRAALIPIRKTEAWWSLAQDERRAIFEEKSRHIGIGMNYLPAVSRRLHHSRDLQEPFDFLTWFEFAPEHEAAFDEMLVRLRATEEWRYVDWEVDLRLSREA